VKICIVIWQCMYHCHACKFLIKFLEIEGVGCEFCILCIDSLIWAVSVLSDSFSPFLIEKKLP